MPATRQLAADLGISRNTVAMTYERLLSEGFVETRGPLGTFVALRGPTLSPAPTPPRPVEESTVSAPAPNAPGRFAGAVHQLRSPRAAAVDLDFWVGRPDPRLFPAAAWKRLVEQALADVQKGDGGYGEPSGPPGLRAAIARHVGAARGIVCGPDDVIVTNGIQEGINIAARLLLGPGVAVGMESPGYLGASSVFASYGARLTPVRVDGDGAMPSTMAPDCRLAYVTPSHQYPSGEAMSAPRRAAWLAWAARCGGYLIEDDYDSDFYFDGAPQPAMKAADAAGCVIYLGTFSKSLAAGLRVGYMIVPAPVRDAAETIKSLMTNGSGTLVQAALAAFLDSGEYEHHLRRCEPIAHLVR